MLCYVGMQHIHFTFIAPDPYFIMRPTQGKTNFFERRVGEYAKAGVKSGSCHEFSIAEDF